MRMAGYAAIFDTPDRGGDIVRRGAFAHVAKGGVPLLRQHDPACRIGFVERLEEDARGLRVIASISALRSPIVHWDMSVRRSGSRADRRLPVSIA